MIIKVNLLKISIITATWNSVLTLENTLESINSQSYINREHIVVDGCSTDGTLELLSKYSSKITKIISEKDSGIYDALNKGINHSTGDIIGFLHADDIYAHQDVLQRIAASFSDNSICAVYGDLEYVSYNNPSIIIRRWKSRKFNKKDLSMGWMPPHPTLYVRKDWYQKIDGFDHRLKISADYLSILTLFQMNDFKTVYLPHVLVKMRLGGASNKSVTALITKSREDWRALRSSGFGFFSSILALFVKNSSKISQFFI